MIKRTLLQATDSVIARKAAIPVHRDRDGSSVFTSGVKALTAITVVAGVVSIFIPVVIGIAVFTGLLTVIGLVMAFVSTLKFDNQYDARSNMFDASINNNGISPSYFGGPFMADRIRTNLDLDI